MSKVEQSSEERVRAVYPDAVMFPKGDVWTDGNVFTEDPDTRHRLGLGWDEAAANLPQPTEPVPPSPVAGGEVEWLQGYPHVRIAKKPAEPVAGEPTLIEAAKAVLALNDEIKVGPVDARKCDEADESLRAAVSRALERMKARVAGMEGK